MASIRGVVEGLTESGLEDCVFAGTKQAKEQVFHRGEALKGLSA